MVWLNFNLHNPCFHTSYCFLDWKHSQNIFKDFHYIFLCKNSSHIVAPPYPRDHNLKKLESALSEDASTKIWAFLAYLFLRGRFLNIFSIHSHVKIHPPPIVAPPYPRGPWFEQIWIDTNWGYLNTSLSFYGQLVFGKNIFKDFLYTFLCKNPSPHCGPTLLPGTVI